MDQEATSSNAFSAFSQLTLKELTEIVTILKDFATQNQFNTAR